MLNVLGAGKPKGLNRISKIDQDNLSFNNNYTLFRKHEYLIAKTVCVILRTNILLNGLVTIIEAIQTVNHIQLWLNSEYKHTKGI